MHCSCQVAHDILWVDTDGENYAIGLGPGARTHLQKVQVFDQNGMHCVNYQVPLESVSTGMQKNLAVMGACGAPNGIIGLKELT